MNLMMIVGLAIEAFMIVIGSTILIEGALERKFSVSFKGVLFILSWIPLSLLFPLIGPPSILSVITMCSAFLFWKTKNLVFSLSISFVSLFVVVIWNYLAQVLVMEIMRIGYQSAIDMIGWLLSYAVTAIGAWTTTYFLRKPFRKLLTTKIFESEFQKWIIGFLLLTFVIFYSDIFMGNYLGFSVYVLLFRGIQLLLYLGLLLGIVWKLHGMYKKDKQNEIDRIQAEQQIHYLSHTETLYEEMRSLHHDYRNVLFGFQGYLEEDDTEGALQYFNDNMARVNSALNKGDFKNSQMKNLNIPAVKGLVASKIVSALAHSVQVKVECTDPLDDISMDNIDFCRCLGILLDNAIEEAVNLEAKDVSVAFINEADHIWVIVSNSCRENLPTVKQMFKRGYSSKGENRGLGLDNLAQIIRKVPNATLESENKNGVFTQHIKIYS